MILKRGITGFFHVGDCTLAEMDYTAFKKFCYSIQINSNHLLDVSNPNNTNYFYAHFNTNGQDIYVLLNKYHPIVGFTNELSCINKFFINVPKKFDCFMNYNVINAKILNSPFANIEHDLSKIELKQIKYWNPSSIGNIIFNEWD